MILYYIIINVYIYTQTYIGWSGKVIHNEAISAPCHGWSIASPLYPHHIGRDPTTLMNHDESYLLTASHNPGILTRIIGGD